MKKLFSAVALMLVLGSALLSASMIGCGDDSATTGSGGAGGSGGTGGTGGHGGTGGTGGSGGPDASCFMPPLTTHVQIINACTDSVKITKNPVLPNLLPDGGLPPLP